MRRKVKDKPVGRPRRPITSEQVRVLRNAGMTTRQIAKVLGVGLGTVARRMDEFMLSSGR
jgi:hypothetical protein